jgi:hypothetical protein
MEKNINIKEKIDPKLYVKPDTKDQLDEESFQELIC